MRVADFIVDQLVEYGITHVYMLSGGAAMHLNDAFGKNDGIECVGNLHEQACAIAAEAHAKYTGKMSVVVVSAGPAATNCITAVAGAWFDSSPMLILSGQVKTNDLKSVSLGVRQYGVQEINIESIVRPITKYVKTLTSKDSVVSELRKAIFLANNGRKGPVWLDLPLDIQGGLLASIQQTPELPSQQATYLDHIVNPSDFSELVEKLAAAERPVLLLGNGIRGSGAQDLIPDFINTLSIPVLTSWLGMDLIEDNHKLFFGRPGGMAPRYSNFVVQNSDFLLVLGSRLDLGMVGYSYQNFARAAYKVVVDIDPNEFNKYTDDYNCIACDASEAIRRIIDAIASISINKRHAWIERCLEWKNRYPLLQPIHLDRKNGLSMYEFSDSLIDTLNNDCVIVPGSAGFAVEIFLLLFRYKKGQRIFHNRGTGSMGFGLPGSIGACIASNHKHTICVDGDGGFQMNVQELEVISRLNLPIKIFVINNDGYASIRSSQNGYFNRLVCADKTSSLTLPSITRIAKAYGISSCQISQDSHLPTSINDVLDSDGPVICEVIVKSDEQRIPRLSSSRQPDGTMISRPLEDLYPFLPRREFLENMIIEPLPSSLT